MSETVWRITLHSAERSVDALSGALYRAGYEGIEIVGEEGSGTVMVRAYAVTRYGIREVTRVASEVPGCSVGTIEEVQVEDWTEGWRKHFKPVPVGARLVVVAPWQAAERHPGRTQVVIEPGRAFGTGTHASTRLVLAAMEALVAELPAEGVVVDLGCGSGVLAIAAAKLGLTPVLALDIDADAVDAARENARRNRVHPFITFIEADHDAVPEQTRLLLANLSAPIHRTIAGRLAPRLAPGGRALLSGLLRDEADGVRRAWPADWKSAQTNEDEWALLSLTAPPTHRS